MVRYRQLKRAGAGAVGRGYLFRAAGSTTSLSNKENQHKERALHMKKYNLTEIMGRAWEVRKAAAAEMGCKVSEVHMGECLKIAWAEAEGGKR